MEKYENYELKLSSSLTPKQIINKYNVIPFKGKGQNFLINPGSLNKIIELSELCSDDVILEIGSGIGNLTRLILPRVKKLYAVEKDKKLIHILTEELKEFKNVIIMNEDILKHRFSHFIQDEGVKIKVIGNLPYNISTPLLFNLIKERRLVSSAVLMFQREFGQRIIADCGSKDYGILSVFCQTFFNIQRGHIINPSSFYPSPKVESIIIKLIPKGHIKIKPELEKNFKILVRAAFGKRRKKLKNALLYSALSITEDILAIGFKRTGISLDRRPQTLTADEFCKLTEALFTKNVC
ncbi:MAG: 16S rRNA (adenine(1518)-N(6)/adenine(1519)-N(6))-dimethyltransferase RsmA [Thermodesulfobacteriota bacterium]|nr:16S rRNA (adenine(1518)-N(6)/adenine(1519)-N(6))-dimethyltransferase RsmA [Thermodesulfobacteriota bacterium]